MPARCNRWDSIRTASPQLADETDCQIPETSRTSIADLTVGERIVLIALVSNLLEAARLAGVCANAP